LDLYTCIISCKKTRNKIVLFSSYNFRLFMSMMKVVILHNQVNPQWNTITPPITAINVYMIDIHQNCCKCGYLNVQYTRVSGNDLRPNIKMAVGGWRHLEFPIYITTFEPFDRYSSPNLTDHSGSYRCVFEVLQCKRNYCGNTMRPNQPWEVEYCGL